MSGPIGTFNPDSLGYRPAAVTQGKARHAIGLVNIPASSVVGTVASWRDAVPWDAIIVPGGSMIANEALGAGVTVSAGVISANGLQAAAAVLLAASTDFSAAGSRALLDTLAKYPAIARFNQPLWQLAGFTSRPEGLATVTITTAGATTTAAIRAIGISLNYIRSDG